MVVVVKVFEWKKREIYFPFCAICWRGKHVTMMIKSHTHTPSIGSSNNSNNMLCVRDIIIHNPKES